MSLLLLAALAVANPPKMPPLDAPEWKPVGDAGLKAWDVRVGTGPAVRAGATLRYHSTAWTAADGKVFYASRQRNAADTQPLADLLKGVQDGLVGVKVGGVRRLVVPPALGFGDRPKPNVPPGSTLVVEVELFDDPLVMPDLNAKDWQPGSEGLRVWDVAIGGGAVVQPGDTVTCHYTGWTTDGKKFDSSIPRGQPTSFSLGGVVRGWTIGIPGMREGGIRRLVIPAAIGYGDKGSPPNIPGGATLVFEIEVRKTER